MRFTFTVEVEADRVSGKFASRDELASQIEEALSGADPGSLTGDADGEYETTVWEVSEQPQPKPVRHPKLAEAAERNRARRVAR